MDWFLLRMHALGRFIGKRLGRVWTSDKASKPTYGEDQKSRLQTVQCAVYSHVTKSVKY